MLKPSNKPITFTEWSLINDKFQRREFTLDVLLKNEANSEYNLFQIEREVLSKHTNVLTKPLLSNILDTDILGKVFSQYEPQIVFHAAAYKHVPMQEKFPWVQLGDPHL